MSLFIRPENIRKSPVWNIFFPSPKFLYLEKTSTWKIVWPLNDALKPVSLLNAYPLAVQIRFFCVIFITVKKEMFTPHSFASPATETLEHHITGPRALTTGLSDEDYTRSNHDSKTLSYQTKILEQRNTEVGTQTIGLYNSDKFSFLCLLNVSFTFSAIYIIVCNKARGWVSRWR